MREIRGTKLARINGIANAAARLGITPSANARTGGGSEMFFRIQCVAERAARPPMPVIDSL
jgi:hypothetical protein